MVPEALIKAEAQPAFPSRSRQQKSGGDSTSSKQPSLLWVSWGVLGKMGGELGRVGAGEEATRVALIG